MRLLRFFLRDTAGGMSIIMSIAAVVLIGSLGGAVDITVLRQQKNELQRAADSAALASARELGLASATEEDIRAIAKQYVFANFSEAEVISKEKPTEIEIAVLVDLNAKWVTVDASYKWSPFFAHVFSDKVTPIRVSSTASLAGDQSICVIALDEKNDQSFLINGASTITANACGVYSNSSSSVGLDLDHRNALLTAASTYTSGGYAGFDSNFTPKPITDSPPIEDPLLSREYPPVEACVPDNTNLSFPSREAQKDPRFNADVLSLSPGTYCEGLTVTGKLEVKFEPGVYIFKDGPLTILGDSTVFGENVGFFFTGDTSTFAFIGSSQVSLTAPDDGPMAGILFFEDRSSPVNRDFRIETRDAERFEGTVYLPRGRFVIDKASRLGQQSNWTAIISHQIESGNGPEIEINSDYSASTIPVPEGIAPSSGQPILTGRKN